MKSSNWFNLMGFITAISCLGLGLLFIWLGGQISQLTCTRLERTQVDCQLQRQFLGFIPVRQQSLARVTTAELQENCTDGCLYWVELLTGEGTVRLTSFTSYNRRGVEAQQQQIAAFLGEPASASFALRGSPSWTLLICSIPLIVAGGFLLRRFPPVWLGRETSPSLR